MHPALIVCLFDKVPFQYDELAHTYGPLGEKTCHWDIRQCIVSGGICKARDKQGQNFEYGMNKLLCFQDN